MSGLTVGSLFDGIGGFPLAAERYGIKPLWASEIERFPIEVTSERFPGMAHQGDITKLKGKELFPVDIICGGSPCQDLSVAGARAGLAGARSGLFMEQVRIVKEMRTAEMERGRTGKEVRPRYMVWENVPGAFSSGEPKGEDFRIVLEELVRVSIAGAAVPPPYPYGWSSAGVIVRGNDFSLAWRCLDAQYWGVAQRRKRIFLVVDFAGLSAPLFLFDMLPTANSEKPCRASQVPQKEDRDLIYAPYMVLDLTPGHTNLFGEPYWEMRSPWRERGLSLNTGVAPRVPIRASLSGILEPYPDKKYYLSRPACLGILRRAEERGKELPYQLETALMAQAGLTPPETAIGGLKAYHINQRDEGIDLGGVSGALMATTNMQMQTFITGEPAAFSAGAGATAGGIGFSQKVTPTLKGSAGGNCMPSVLCLNDQGGAMMSVAENLSGTLRAQEHGHQPLMYENHGIDARYTGPHRVAPTLSARAGTGGNNLPLVTEEEVPALCHTVFSRQRMDVFLENDVVSTESARQHKDATDLVYQETVGALTSSDRKGPNSQYVGQDKLVVDGPWLIRRLTPLECERLQGFPDGWTALSGAADSARYKALGNSVAIPCVEFLMSGISTAAELSLSYICERLLYCLW